MLDVWESDISNSKAIKIGWWLAVTLLILLIYRRLHIDMSFIVIAFIVCILYLFSFAADNGAEIDPHPLYLILAWIIMITILYVVLNDIQYGICVTVAVSLVALVAIIAWIGYGSSSYSSIVVIIAAVILLIVTLAIHNCYSTYASIVTILTLIIVVMLAMDNYVKEALLVIVIAGMIIGFKHANAMEI